jgi:hypothetical protein
VAVRWHMTRAAALRMYVVYVYTVYTVYIPYTERSIYCILSGGRIRRVPRAPGATVHTFPTRHLAIEYAFSAHMPILNPSLRICSFVPLLGIVSRGVRRGVRCPRGDQKVGSELVHTQHGAMQTLTQASAHQYSFIPSMLSAPPPSSHPAGGISRPQGAWPHRARQK